MDGTASQTAFGDVRARFGSPLQADCLRFLWFELNRVWVSFVVVQLLSSRGEYAPNALPREKIDRSMPGGTTSRRNFGARNLVSRRPGKRKLSDRREQSFQRRALSNDPY